MEVPQVSIKQEEIENITLATESNVGYKSEILDLMEIKIDPLNLESGSYKSEFNNLDQELKLSEKDVKIIGYDDEHMVDCSLNELSSELSKQKDSRIKLEKTEIQREIEQMEDIHDAKWAIEMKQLNSKHETNIEDKKQRLNELSSELSKQKNSRIKLEKIEIRGEIEQMEDIHVVKWEIENEQLNIKHEINIENEKQRKAPQQLVRRQPQRKTRAASGAYKADYMVNKQKLKLHGLKTENWRKVHKYRCDQCDFKTVYKGNLKIHSLKHKNPDELDIYKCDQCNYQTVHKEYLKKHSFTHKNSVGTDMHKCNHCDYQTFHRHKLKTHSIRHITSDMVLTKQVKKKFKT